MTSIAVHEWSAWTPGRPGRDPMQEWLTGSGSTLEDLRGKKTPEVEDVSSRQLRRCSKITRLGLKAAFDAVKPSGYAPDEVQLVWVTRHGEIEVTIDLLEDLAGDEMLMPMAFSNSVPNTPPAYYDIATGNTLTTRAVCAGPDSFHQGLIDAAGLLRTNPDHPVLVVHADGLLPSPLDTFNDDCDVPLGVGLVLEPPESGETIEFSPATDGNGSGTVEEPPALSFLRWYLGTDSSQRIQSKDSEWVWKRRE